MSVVKGTDGKLVLCQAWAPKSGTAPHTVGRDTCLRRPHEACSSCGHAEFSLSFQPGLGSQAVACPRWKNETGWREGELPDTYVVMRRGTCLSQRPFDFCTECPNRRPANAPKSEPGWVNDLLRELRARRIAYNTAPGRFEDDAAATE